MAIILLRVILFVLDNIYILQWAPVKGCSLFLRSLYMSDTEIIKEYHEKIKECNKIIQENTRLNLQLREALKEIEGLKQDLQHLIENNS